MIDSLDYKAIIHSQRVFFDAGGTRDVRFRIKQLATLYATIVEYTPKINSALAADLGRCEMEAYTHDIGICLNDISHTLKHLKKWAAPQKAKPPKPLFLSSGYVINEPYGVTLIIGPWNFPFSLVLLPLIGAISAGNCAVVKPSELAPASEAVLREMIGKSFDPRYIAVVCGDATISQELLKEHFDYLFFTGSENVGKTVMRAAAEHLTPLTLELGGKSPCIIDTDGNLERAVRRVVWGKFMNAGQVCVAPDYLLVHESRVNETIALLEKTIRQFYGENPMHSKDYGRIINRKHFNRLCGYLSEGKVVCGGEVSEEVLYVAPTVMIDCETESAVMQEEIFGPILPIVSYTILDEAVAYVNKRPKPLALYIFSSNRKNTEAIIRETSSGGVAINDTVVQIVSEYIPFGGVGTSGFGKYHGKYSYLTFSNQRGVVKNTMLFDIPRFPPFRSSNLKMMKFFFR